MKNLIDPVDGSNQSFLVCCSYLHIGLSELLFGFGSFFFLILKIIIGWNRGLNLNPTQEWSLTNLSIGYINNDFVIFMLILFHHFRQLIFFLLQIDSSIDEIMSHQFDFGLVDFILHIWAMYWQRQNILQIWNRKMKII